MRIAVLASYVVDVFPGMLILARQLAQAGADVLFVNAWSSAETLGIRHERLDLRLVPGSPSDPEPAYQELVAFQPDWVVAHSFRVVPALLYKLACPPGRVRVAAYYADYYRDAFHIEFPRIFADSIDAYVDVCEMRVAWRRRDWPLLRAPAFVQHQAPERRPGDGVAPHSGPPRLVHTGSGTILDRASPERLSQFLGRLCTRGVAVDWYFLVSGEAGTPPETLCSHPLYRVLPVVPKAELEVLLPDYDAGLFWAPLADYDPARPYDDSVFISSASNKIGEYLAAGLAVAHTGNPGLDYLRAEACFVFDPTDPEAGADQLADRLFDRPSVESARRSAFRYHQEDMNAEVQNAAFIQHVMSLPGLPRSDMVETLPSAQGREDVPVGDGSGRFHPAPPVLRKPRGTHKDMLFHLHIPKTGGTSLFQMLSNAVHPGRSHVATSEQELIDRRDGYALLGGHFNWDVLALFPRPPRVLTLVRDPIDVMLSLYAYWREWAPQGIFDPATQASADLAATHTIDQLLLDPTSGLRTSANLHLYYLAGESEVRAGQGAKAALLHLDACAWVGTTATLDRDVRLLPAMLGLKRAKAVPYTVRSSNPPRWSDIGPEAKRVLEEITAADRIVYDHARGIAERQQQMYG